MKKILSAIGQFPLRAGLSSIFTASVAFSFAQISPTWDFETWSTMNNGTIAVPEEPKDWVTGNQLVNAFTAGNDTSVFKATGTDAHGGQYAMKITTVDVANNPLPASIPDPTGVAFTGKVTVVFPAVTVQQGFPNTNRPATAEFWYKYTPVGNDSAVATVLISRWNGTAKDTIATGYFMMKTAVSSYTMATVNLTYNSAFPASTVPDTMFVYFSATCWANFTCGTVGSTLWVDDFTFSGWNGINEHPASNGVILFPNPADDLVNISVDSDDATIVIAYDATGRMVTSVLLSESIGLINKKAGVINVSDLASGLYSYSVLDKGGNALRSGKFSVVR